MTDSTPDTQFIELAADIVGSYVANNSVAARDLPALIEKVHTALREVATGSMPVEEVPLVPAVPVRRSVTPDYIICLEDGKKFKSLKRHLRTKFDMSPEQYRAKWSLPKDYPMVAPNYAASRSALAHQMGLGRKPTDRPALPAPASAEAAPAKAPGRGRRKAA